MVKRLYSIGVPAILNLALPSILISSLNAILAAYSQVHILVLGIYYKLQMFLYLPANGIVQGFAPSSAITMVPGSMAVSKRSTALPWPCAPPLWPPARCSASSCRSS